jgi:hypothetical protein
MMKKKRKGEMTKRDVLPTQQSGFSLNNEVSPILISHFLMRRVGNSATGMFFANSKKRREEVS